MEIVNIFNIPREFTVGDSITWIDRDIRAIDPSTRQEIILTSSAWNLVYFVRGTSEITINGVANGNGWLLSLVGLSFALEAGKHWCQIVAYNPSYRLTVGKLEINVFPDLLTLTNYDGRSDLEKELDAVNAAIAAVLKDGVAEYEIKGRKATFLDLESLRALRTELRWRINTSNKSGNQKNVKIRFN